MLHSPLNGENLSPFATATSEWNFVPKLFTLYVNQLINKLIACNAGCYFNSTCMCINNVMYADDICLLASHVIK